MSVSATGTWQQESTYGCLRFETMQANMQALSLPQASCRSTKIFQLWSRRPDVTRQLPHSVLMSSLHPLHLSALQLSRLKRVKRAQIKETMPINWSECVSVSMYLRVSRVSLRCTLRELSFPCRRERTAAFKHTLRAVPHRSPTPLPRLMSARHLIMLRNVTFAENPWAHPPTRRPRQGLDRQKSSLLAEVKKAFACRV